MKRCEICGDEIPNVNGKGKRMTPTQVKARKTCNKRECRSESMIRSRCKTSKKFNVTYTREDKFLYGRVA